jgi:hypothetical protein
VVVALLGHNPLGGIAAALATVLINAGTLVYDFAGGARDHRDLKRRFYELLAEVEGPEPDTRAIHRRMILAFAEEPPTHRALNALAHNQAGDLIWGPGKFSRVRVSLLARVTRHVLTWRTAAFAPNQMAED